MLTNDRNLHNTGPTFWLTPMTGLAEQRPLGRCPLTCPASPPTKTGPPPHSVFFTFAFFDFFAFSDFFFSPSAATWSELGP